MMIRVIQVAALLVLFAGPASAANLAAGPDDPLWMHLGAWLLLYGHIAGGAVGLVSGTAAILSPKGGRVHRAAGKVFFVSMFIAYAIGAGVAPFLDEGQRPNFVAGVMALYLLVTAWMAAKRRDPVVGWPEYAGLAIAVSVLAMGLIFLRQASQDPSGTVDGSPPQAFILFTVLGTCAVLGDLNVILRRSISGVSRIARHLWRMCMSLFVAAGSFFMGQQQALPDFMLGTLWQFGPVLFPLAALAIWLVIVHLPKRRRRRRAPGPA